MQKIKSVDDYIAGKPKWSAELSALRTLLNRTELTEEVKWGAPCYTLNNQNVIGMLAFKDYFGLWFHQGVFLKDESNVLINAQEGKTKALRQWRMSSPNDINEKIVSTYIDEAIANAKSGKKVPVAQAKQLIMPPELSDTLKDDDTANSAFEAFTPGKQREFADYISEAKQAATKTRRIEKILPMIKSGVGLNDKYK